MKNGNGHHANGNGSATRDRPSDAFRLPPQNIEAEMGVIGGVLLDNSHLDELVAFLKSSDFYRDSHQLIYRAIVDIYSQGKPVDYVTLADELTRRDQFQKIGGDDAFTKIFESVPHAANTLHYAQIVRQKSITRQLIEGATEIIRDGYSNQFTAEQLFEKAQGFVLAASDNRSGKDPVLIRDVLAAAMDRITSRTGGRVVGISSGFHEIDDITGGLGEGQLIVLAARPSMGKTALGLNIAERVSLRNIETLFISLEMSEQELTDRMLAGIAKIDSHKIRTGKGMGREEYGKLESAYAALRLAALSIDDSDVRTVTEAAAVARRHKAKRGLGLLVIDYLQLMEAGSESNSKANRQEQVAAMSRRLKTLARDLRVPVIVLSQLNRESEKRADKRPTMADLRESGAIEQEADLILLLHRPDYYKPDDSPGIAELNVAKNRNGRTGLAKLTFLKHLIRFEDIAVDPFSGKPF